MSAHSPHATRRHRRARLRLWLGLTAGVVAIGAVAGWRLLQSAREPASASEETPALVELREESRRLEREFLSAGAGGTPSEADLQRLQRAITAQREWIAGTGNTEPAPARRLAELEGLYDGAWQRHTVARSAQAEAEARRHLAAGAREAALEHLRAALDGQRLLNQRHGLDSGRDLPRETLLVQEIDRLEAGPLATELAAVLAEAQRLNEAGQTAPALSAYRRAHELQTRLNREFNRTQFADLQQLDRIEVELATLESAPLLAQVMAWSTQAAEAQERGASTEAVGLFERALGAQQQLNGDFPRSRHASAERAETLEVARQTELSAEGAARVAQLDREIAAKLRIRDLANVPELLLEGARLQDTLFTQQPRSRRLDPELRRKFNYLLLQRDVLDPILRVLADKFRPVPGRGVRMLATELPQRLFEFVMRANPSRQVGGELPVESVSEGDAQEFCRRLAWILGRPVRLPTEAEYRAALGEAPDSIALTAQSWSLERSEDRIHTVASTLPNRTGFYDLLGNVAEWLAPERPDAEQTSVAGGSYGDPEAALMRVPLERRGRGERARTIGFRVVVE